MAVKSIKDQYVQDLAQTNTDAFMFGVETGKSALLFEYMNRHVALNTLDDALKNEIVLNSVKWAVSEAFAIGCKDLEELDAIRYGTEIAVTDEIMKAVEATI